MENLTRLEKMEKTISETNVIVKDLQEKLTSEIGGIKSSFTVLDKTLVRNARTAVKSMLKLLSKRAEPVILTFEVYDDVVKAVRDEVVKEILINQTNRLWAKEDILHEAFYQVWMNKRDDHMRQLSGKKTNHRASNRRNKRRITKLNKRLGAVEKSRRSAEWKARAKTVLTRECTSPDMTDNEDGSDQRYVLPLFWESHLLRDVKEHLDELGHVKDQEDHPTRYTTVQASHRVPSWAIRDKCKQTSVTSMRLELESSASLPSPVAVHIASLPSTSSSNSSSSSSPPRSPSINIPSSPDLFSDFSFSPASLPQSTPTSRPGKRRSF